MEELIHEAEKRGMGIMLDMVFNHTSTHHQWFQKALSGDEKYMDYYIFRDVTPEVPPTNWESKFGGSAWEYVPKLKKWYLHLFDVTQADLNWKNPRVREELKDIKTLSPRMDQQISKKVASFLSQSGNQPYAHINEGYVVVVKMNGEADATDVISDYLKKRTELMY